MNPEKRATLETQLNEQGLSVLLTRDYDALLLQLARLAQFERLLLSAADGNPHLKFAVNQVQHEQRRFDGAVEACPRPLVVLDIPQTLREVNVALHAAIDSGCGIRPELIRPATAAFIGLICRS